MIRHTANPTKGRRPTANAAPEPAAQAGARSHLTPPQVAQRYGVSPEKVIAWIRAGELRAVNVATTLGGRPRWRIDPADLALFEARRAAVPVPAARRRRVAGDVIEYF
jgi:hypothetical protein